MVHQQNDLLLLFNGCGVDSGQNSQEGAASRRLVAIYKALEKHGYNRSHLVKPNPIRRSLVERIHDVQYLDRLEEMRGRSKKIYQSRGILPGSMEAIYMAAGAAVDGLTAMFTGNIRCAFGLVEPPGHHAERDRGMGFCAVNNIAIAAIHAIEYFGCKRILIVDWDIHHGNGTQHAFEDRKDVLFFDCHQEGLFPGSGFMHEIGSGEGLGFTVNVPLPKGMTNDDYHAIFSELLVPIADDYQPDLVLVSAGFDSHIQDPLGEMLLDEMGFATLTSIVSKIATQYANGRLLLMLEGGYNSEAVARCVLKCITVLLGSSIPTHMKTTGVKAWKIIKEIHAYRSEIGKLQRRIVKK